MIDKRECTYGDAKDCVSCVRVDCLQKKDFVFCVRELEGPRFLSKLKERRRADDERMIY